MAADKLASVSQGQRDHRIEHSLIESECNPMPSAEIWKAFEQAFALEQKLKDRREQSEGRKFYLLGKDLFGA
jgi:hypothetical protein